MNIEELEGLLQPKPKSFLSLSSLQKGERFRFLTPWNQKVYVFEGLLGHVPKISSIDKDRIFYSLVNTMIDERIAQISSTIDKDGIFYSLVSTLHPIEKV